MMKSLCITCALVVVACRQHSALASETGESVAASQPTALSVASQATALSVVALTEDTPALDDLLVVAPAGEALPTKVEDQVRGAFQGVPLATPEMAGCASPFCTLALTIPQAEAHRTWPPVHGRSTGSLAKAERWVRALADNAKQRAAVYLSSSAD